MTGVYFSYFFFAFRKGTGSRPQWRGVRYNISNSFPSATNICFSRFRVYAHTQPLTPRNAHALRYEFSRWRTGQRGKLKNTKRFCNEFSTYTLVRKANPRKKDTKLYDIEIDMILNRYRGPV